LFGKKNSDKKFEFSNEGRADFMKFAKSDKQLVKEKIGGGYYQCYCKHFNPFATDGLCYMATWDKGVGYSLTGFVTIAIQVVNFALKKLVIFAAHYIGYHTDSERITTIMVVTFVSSFINTAIIPLLTNANFAYTTILKIIPMRQNYSDFDEGWYLTIGNQIVKTMLIQVFMPFIGWLIGEGMRVPF
jgi:hypothetical protein